MPQTFDELLSMWKESDPSDSDRGRRATIEVMDTAHAIFCWLVDHGIPVEAQGLALLTRLVMDHAKQLRRAEDDD